MFVLDPYPHSELNADPYLQPWYGIHIPVVLDCLLPVVLGSVGVEEVAVRAPV